MSDPPAKRETEEQAKPRNRRDRAEELLYADTRNGSPKTSERWIDVAAITPSATAAVAL